MPPRGESERRKEIRRGEFDPQTGRSTTPTVPTGGGISGGGGDQNIGFELPEWLLKRLRQGVTEYETPLALQMLQWQGALEGQTDPFMMQQAAESMFTPQQFLAEDSRWPRYFKRRNPRGPGSMGNVAGSEEYNQWLAEKTAQVRPGIEGGAPGGRAGGFLPEMDPYMEELQGTLDEFAAQLGVSEEAFEANLAQRGISGAGQATEARFRDVTAPVMRAGAQATRQAFLDYLQTYQRGSIAAEGFRQQDIGRLTGTELAVGEMAQTTGSQNLSRLLQGYMEQGRLDLGFENLALQSRVAGREFAFRAYENKIRLWMFQEEMAQRERENKRNMWSTIFGGMAEAGTTYLLGGGGGGGEVV